MKLSMECECGNKADFFSFGEMDETGAESVEIEDDDRFALSPDRRGLRVACKFCGYKYVIFAT